METVGGGKWALLAKSPEPRLAGQHYRAARGPGKEVWRGHASVPNLSPEVAQVTCLHLVASPHLADGSLGRVV